LSTQQHAKVTSVGLKQNLKRAFLNSVKLFKPESNEITSQTANARQLNDIAQQAERDLDDV